MALKHGLKVVVIEQSMLLRRGIAALAEAASMHCVALCQSATEGFRAVVELRPDVVVIGTCPDANHGGLLERMHRTAEIHSVIVTPVSDLLAVYSLYRFGAIAVISPLASEDEFAAMLALVSKGQRYVPPNLLINALDKSAPKSVAGQPKFELTARERDVLGELALGSTNREIADRLCIGVETVKSHLNSIYSKFAVSRRSQAVSVAIRHKLL